MDMSQLRKLDASGGKRATDASINLLVNSFVLFFSQFKNEPTKQQLKEYQVYINRITIKINESEYSYYLGKYKDEVENNAKSMASQSILQSFKDIPIRMQYWAASGDWGSPVRNAENHTSAVKSLDKWSSLVGNDSSMTFFKTQEFKTSEKEEEKTASVNP